jgi:hypothetical protein
MAHLEIVLAERGKQNGDATATVVGEEEAAASARPKPRAAAKKRSAHPAKKKVGVKR